jgi:hypothetical protein
MTFPEDLFEDRGVVERPVVEPHAVLTESLLRGVVRRGDVAVQRHAHVDDHVAHVVSSAFGDDAVPG